MSELPTAVYPVNDAAGDILSGSVTAPAGDSHVSLRLVSSTDDRVLSIRDHLLLLVHQDGELEVQRGPVRMVTWERAPWVIHHWTPFNELHPGEASSPGYRHAVERQHSTPDLPYGLEVWFGVKVLSVRGPVELSVLWADDGRFEVASFVRGPWEDLALAL
jgi:hypothetical protein